MTAKPPLWTTSSYGQAAETTPADLATLSEHAAQCTVRSGRMVALQCGATRIKGIVASRLVTTLALLAMLVGAGLLLLL